MTLTWQGVTLVLRMWGSSSHPLWLCRTCCALSSFSLIRAWSCKICCFCLKQRIPPAQKHVICKYSLNTKLFCVFVDRIIQQLYMLRTIAGIVQNSKGKHQGPHNTAKQVKIQPHAFIGSNISLFNRRKQLIDDQSSGSRASQSMGDMSGEYAGHATTGTFSAMTRVQILSKLGRELEDLFTVSLCIHIAIN